ncbi:trypsin, alkaline B-like [Epargyreus clarus]|uniref:trypsin, alkaline B-like n=1 Tax=Epargyreus clarus TaxID=520877 RepID=UPI003C2F0B1B
MATKVLFLALAILGAVLAAPESRESRIVGGRPVNIQEFPYVAALVYFYPRPQIYIQRCVGGIISSWIMASTAFCFLDVNLSNMRARAGSTYSMSGGVVTNVQRYVQHPDYVQNPRTNDIALVFLQTPLLISNTVNVLYLPPPGTNIPDGTPLRVVSWGFETEGGPQLHALKSISLNKISNEQCEASFAGIDGVSIDDNVICAANPGYGTCFGDSGAPMAINNVLVGVASVYHECGTDTVPDVFVRVDRFTNWIMDVAGASRSGVLPRIAA